MIIAIDYDHTYSADPPMWNEIIKTMQAHGHLVYCVTARHQEHSKQPLATIGKLCRVFFTDKTAKREYMLKQGIIINIWIDDKPEAILLDDDDY
jgi:hypothetical protein